MYTRGKATNPVHERLIHVTMLMQSEIAYVLVTSLGLYGEPTLFGVFISKIR